MEANVPDTPPAPQDTAPVEETKPQVSDHRDVRRNLYKAANEHHAAVTGEVPVVEHNIGQVSGTTSKEDPGTYSIENMMSVELSPYIQSGMWLPGTPPLPDPVKHPEADTPAGRAHNYAMAVSPDYRNAQQFPHHDLYNNTPGHTFGQSLVNGLFRDSFLGNSLRLLDQVTAEVNRNDKDAVRIWDAKDELLMGISPQNHGEILNAPTFDLAIRESQRLRHSEYMLHKDRVTGLGQTMLAESLGFFMDPSNLIPGYAMVKTYKTLDRFTHLSRMSQGMSLTSKALAFGAAGAIEETMRMYPRYMADPTYEAREYATGIAISAAFTGLLPLAFSGVRNLGSGLPTFVSAEGDNLRRALNQYGIDRAIRQAYELPGAVRDTDGGLRNMHNARRLAAERAREHVDSRFRDIRASGAGREVRRAVNRDASSPDNTMRSMDRANQDYVQEVGDAIRSRVSRSTNRIQEQVEAARSAEISETAVQEYIQNQKNISVVKTKVTAINTLAHTLGLMAFGPAGLLLSSVYTNRAYAVTFAAMAHKRMAGASDATLRKMLADKATALGDTKTAKLLASRLMQGDAKAESISEQLVHRIDEIVAGKRQQAAEIAARNTACAT